MALEKMEKTIRYLGDRYEVGLPWKDGDPHLPDNSQAVLRRFHALEKRFSSDPLYAQRYTAVMEEYVTLGHARLIPDEELTNTKEGRLNFVPHHGVVTPTNQRRCARYLTPHSNSGESR